LKNNTFIWTDLSTYFPQKSIAFYQAVFNWQFQSDNQYQVAYKNVDEIVGIYETPDFFKKIKMPHFWMNYIQVENLERMTELAQRLNGKVELTNEEFYGGRIALIRDPMGAGFTIYEGDQFNQTTSLFHGVVIGRELHTSTMDRVIDFYSQLFNWKINFSEQDQRYYAYTQEGAFVASFMEIENAIKGKYEYWVTIFGVADLQQTNQEVLKNGGMKVIDEGSRILYTDNMGEAFFYIEALSG